MSNFKTTTVADLDEKWVSDLLVTAFDGQYGGCWYWVNEEREQGNLTKVSLIIDDEVWKGAEFFTPEPDNLSFTGPPTKTAKGYSWRLDKAKLDVAWAKIVTERPIRSDLVEQFTRSQHEGDLDVDADAADCLVQIALFGEVVYA